MLAICISESMNICCTVHGKGQGQEFINACERIQSFPNTFSQPGKMKRGSHYRRFVAECLIIQRSSSYFKKNQWRVCPSPLLPADFEWSRAGHSLAHVLADVVIASCLVELPCLATRCWRPLFKPSPRALWPQDRNHILFLNSHDKTEARSHSLVSRSTCPGHQLTNGCALLL